MARMGRIHRLARAPPMFFSSYALNVTLFPRGFSIQVLFNFSRDRPVTRRQYNFLSPAQVHKLTLTDGATDAALRRRGGGWSW